MATSTDKVLVPRNSLYDAGVCDQLVQHIEQQARELSEALQQERAVSEILRAMSSSPTDVQSVLDTVAKNAARLCDVADAEILQVEGSQLRLVAKHGRSQLWALGKAVSEHQAGSLPHDDMTVVVVRAV